MHNMLHCRRGSVAFATVIALVPLIGLVALGAEAGSWYATKQNAQNAADTAAYAAAVQEACVLSKSSGCDTSQDYVYRGKQFAAQSAFCNTNDATAYPGSSCGTNPTGISRSVQINLLTSWNGVNGTFVQAIVGQQQPAYLAKVLGLSTVNINAGAVAKLQGGLQSPPCALALTGSISFKGSPNINAPSCGMASDSTAQNALNFTGGGMTINLGSLSTVGGCSGAASFCKTAFTNQPVPVPNPFAALDSDLVTLCGANPSATCGLAACPGSALVPYTAANKCTNTGITTKGNTAVTLTAGVYFISGTLSLKGGSSLTCTAAAGGCTLILLPGANIDTKGGGTLTIAGLTSAPSTSSLPAAFQADASLFQYMAIYDASQDGTVTFGGTSNLNLTGNIYAPTATVTFQGNPTLTIGGAQCGQLIAASIAFNGNATFNDTAQGCGASQLQSSQFVQLVP
jgi:hypothetical protein